MIRVVRGPEPAPLREVRARKLAACAGLSPGARAEQLDGYNLPEVRHQLFERQGRKCAYCERTIGESGNPIEHFRPRRGAVRAENGGSPKSPEHYWWLTWTWENLLLACESCNNPAAKFHRFPIGGPEAPEGCADAVVLAAELGLVDPGAVDPLDFIRWVPANPRLQHLPRREWSWQAVPIDPARQGQRTLRTLRWEAGTLYVDVTDHNRRTVLPRYEHLCSAAADAAVRSRLITDLLAQSSPFAAAAWCALEWWREADGQKLPPFPRPGGR